MRTGQRIRVLIPFASSGYLYGMERAVIETFDLLRPEIEPVFLVSASDSRDLPVFQELRRRNLTTVLLSDTGPWPRIGKPQSVGHFFQLLAAVTQGNLDAIRHARGCDAIYIPGTLHAYAAIAAMLWFRLDGRMTLLAHHELAPHHQARLDLINMVVTHHLHVSQFAAGWVGRTNPAVLHRPNIVLIHRTEPPGCSQDSPAELETGGPNIVCISQLTWPKGIDLLVDAFTLVRDRHPSAQLHLIGTGPAEIPGDPNIHRWGFRNDPGTFVRRATLLVQPTPPSRYLESWGRSAVEAISMGVPVVCFANGSLEDVVQNEATGIVCREESAEALATGMLHYLDDPELRASHAANCLAEAERRFSAGAIRQNWLRFFGLET